MEDLKETTHKIHYERFRFDKLREMMYPGGPRDYRVSTNIVWYSSGIWYSMLEFEEGFCCKSI